MTDPDDDPPEPSEPGELPGWAQEDTPETPMTQLRERAGRWLAALLAVFLVVPAGAWLVDTIVFDRRGDQVAEAVPELADAVALVSRSGCDGTAGTGSGFAVSYDGGPAVITNRHVVENAATVGLRTLEGELGPAITEVLLSDSEDVAVLRLAEPLGSALSLGRTLEVGDRVRLVGFPGARPITTAGEVAATGRRRAVLDFPVGGGASGAPVVDEDGVVVAQVVARRPDGSGVVIPAPAVADGIADARPAPSC